MPHTDDPHITKDMYNLAISLIQSFDEMEGKESRWGQRIIVHLTAISDFGIGHQRAVLFPLLCAQYMPNEMQFNPEIVYFNSDTSGLSYYCKCSCLIRKADVGSRGLTSPERGSALVFLPGINEIIYMQESLAKLVHKR